MTTLTFQSFQVFPRHYYDMPPPKIKRRKKGGKSLIYVAHILTGLSMAKIPVGSPLKTLKFFPTQTHQKLSLLENNISSFLSQFLRVPFGGCYFVMWLGCKQALSQKHSISLFFCPYSLVINAIAKAISLLFTISRGMEHGSTSSLEIAWTTHIHVVSRDILGHTHPRGLWRQTGLHAFTWSLETAWTTHIHGLWYQHLPQTGLSRHHRPRISTWSQVTTLVTHNNMASAAAECKYINTASDKIPD